MRAFIPELAFQALVPKHLRAYLGNWAKESTVDIYTREKRAVVCKIWAKVISNLPSLNLSGGQLARDDLEHPDWDDNSMQISHLQQSAVKLADSPVTAPRKKKAKTQVQSIDSDTEASGSILEVLPVLQTTTSLPSSASHQRLAADLVPEPLGPLTVMIRLQLTGPIGHKSHKVHLFTPALKSVGDGWCPSRDKVGHISKEDYESSPELYDLCANCFRKFTWPQNWGLVPVLTGNASDEEAPGSDSDSDTASNDSQSEAEALPLMTIRHETV